MYIPKVFFKNTDREKLVYEIYKTADKMAEQMDNDKKLLVEQWVNAYNNMQPESIERIKKEVKMSFTATTISEHIWNEGKNEGIVQGEIKGLIKGELKGELKGQIKILEKLYQSAILTQEQFETMITPPQKTATRYSITACQITK